MKSETEEFSAKLETHETTEKPLTSFELYEEYTQHSIHNVIEERKDRYAKADRQTRRKLETEVTQETEDFQEWLRKTKGYEPITAHYYSISLKSLLLGLPIGLQLAQLFNVMILRALPI